MNNVIKWSLLFFGCFFEFKMSNSSDMRVVNLIVVNTLSETENVSGYPVTHQLANALVDNQFVICTKQSWYTLQQKAKNLSKDVSLFEKMKDIQELTMRDGADPSILFEKINVYHDDIDADYNRLKITLYTSYEIIKARNYICKELSEKLILFVPRDMLQADVSQEILNVSQNEHINIHDLILGMKFSDLPHYDYVQEVRPYQSSDSGIIEVLSTLGLKKQLSKKYGDSLYNILPQMNIMLLGHGMYTDNRTICEIEMNQFPNFLKVINQDYITKSLMIVSCFAGANVPKIANLFKDKNYFEHISYPILIGSGLPASFLIDSRYSAYVSVESERKVQECIYDINGTYFYGIEKKWNGKGLYTQLFEYLNYQQFYTRKTSSGEQYSYSTFVPEYEKAVQVFGDQHGMSESLENIFVIKFPNSAHWFSLSALHARILEIGDVRSFAHTGGIIVSDQIQDIFLKTNYVKNKIVIKGSLSKRYIIPGLIGISYSDIVRYYIEQLELSDYDSVENVVKSFFEVELLKKLEQSFVVFIKKMKIGSNVYQNMILQFKYVVSGGFNASKIKFAVYSYTDMYLNEIHKVWFYQKDNTILVDANVDINDLKSNISETLISDIKIVKQEALSGFKKFLGTAVKDLNFNEVETAISIPKNQKPPKLPKSNNVVNRQDLIRALELALEL